MVDNVVVFLTTWPSRHWSKVISVLPSRRYHVRTARVAQMELHLHALGAVLLSFGSTGCSRKFHGAGSFRRALPRWARCVRTIWRSRRMLSSSTSCWSAVFRQSGPQQ